jgi:dienelactone hydrolase
MDNDPGVDGIPPTISTHYQKWADPQLDSLADVSIDALRARHYGSIIRIETRLGAADGKSDYDLHYSTDGSPAYNSYLASYQSDGLRIYSRVDVPPSPPPEDGYPVMIFVHGWVGKDTASEFDFHYKAGSQYSRYIDAFVDAGYLVLTPGLRGHGTVNSIPAEGIEFLQAWDNGSYINPVFYAIDILNLIDGIQSLDTTDWTNWGYQNSSLPRVNPSIIHINGHSQGGDAALMVMAVSGEGSTLMNAVSSGSLWSGCFGTRFDQVQTYGPMMSTIEAFVSGDGTWTGSAVGRDGSINPNFVFAWPPDWIGTVDTDSLDWTWQANYWKLKTVAEALQMKFSQMYDAVNKNAQDINDAAFEIVILDDGKVEVIHDPRIVSAMYAIGAYNSEQYLTEPLLLHHSDQDYYSIPDWNADLSARINASGGNSRDYKYTGNTHSLLVSQHEWFNKEGIVEGFGTMIERDLDLSKSTGPETTYP